VSVANEDKPPMLEALISRALDLRHMGERALWLQAELAVTATRDYGLSAAAWATEIGCSAAWVRSLCRTHRAFPQEDARVALLPFSVHAACAATSDPSGWLQRAEAGAWSVRDLRAAIRQAQAGDATEDARVAGERILQRLRRWSEDAPAEVRREVLSAFRVWAAEQG
jgi:hypothetical protein